MSYREVHLFLAPNSTKLAALRIRLPKLKVNKSCDPRNIPTGSVCYQYPSNDQTALERTAKAMQIAFEWGVGPAKSFNSVAVYQGFAFFTNTANGSLDIYQVRNIFGITLASQIKIGAASGPLYVAVDGLFAYLGGSSEASGQDFVIVDVSDPFNPKRRGSILNCGVRTVLYDNDRVYGSGNGGVSIIDVSNVDKPRIITTDLADAATVPVKMSISGRRLFGASPSHIAGLAYMINRWKVGGFFCNNISTGSLETFRLNADELIARRGSFDGDVVVSQLTAQQGFQAHLSTVNPTTTDLPSQHWTVWANSALGEVRLWYNDGGVMKSVLLT